MTADYSNDAYRRKEALAAKAEVAKGSEHADNWLKSEPWSAKEVLRVAGKCKVAEDALGRVKGGTPEYDAAFSSGQKTCMTFNDEYAEFVKAYGGGAIPFLWRYCGENHGPKLCEAMRGWIETHP